jgi:N-acetyl-beta-hexosaminidase
LEISDKVSPTYRCQYDVASKGKFYRISDMMQLIDYCKERHIEFVPEIDMQGHSQAFERAMGVSMQSTEGVQIVKEIIKEVCQTYPIKYLHIGEMR